MRFDDVALFGVTVAWLLSSNPDVPRDMDVGNLLWPDREVVLIIRARARVFSHLDGARCKNGKS